MGVNCIVVIAKSVTYIKNSRVDNVDTGLDDWMTGCC